MSRDPLADGLAVHKRVLDMRGRRSEHAGGDEEAQEAAALRRTVYKPSPGLRAAMSDAQVLSYAFRSDVYSDTSPDTELPVGKWAIYVKPAGELLVEECAPLALRVRQASESAVVSEWLLVCDVDGTWRCREDEFDSLSVSFATLAELVTFQRRLVYEGSLFQVLQDDKDLDLPELEQVEWVGNEFLLRGEVDRHTLTKEVRASNTSAYARLSRAQPSASVTLAEAPFTVPHVWLGLLAMGSSRFTVGYYSPCMTWFLLHACGKWARCSYSLQALVASTGP